jgi:hypothetical protein
MRVDKIHLLTIHSLLSIRIDQQNLENIVSQAGYNCLEFIELVKENEALLDRMKVSAVQLISPVCCERHLI